MDELEQKLAWALRPTEPPAGFTDGVMARLARQRRGRTRKVRVWLAAAVLIGVLSGGALIGRQERQHAREEFARQQIARQQFDLAMQVTGRTVAQAQEVMNRIGMTQ